MANKLIQLSEGADNLYPGTLRKGIQLEGSTGTVSIPGVSNAKFGMLIGIYATRAYTGVFDVASAANTGHQMYISNSAYCNYQLNLQNETITISTLVGFTDLYVMLYA